MVRVSTILENGTSSPFEVRSESSCGVHTVLKTLGPQETFRLERSTSDTYLQHWVVMGSAVVLSFSSDELVDNDKITIVSDGSIYKKVVNARPLRSASLWVFSSLDSDVFRFNNPCVDTVVVLSRRST